MLSGVPNLAFSHRLHERLLDAEGRPHLRVRLPAARPHGRAPATPQCVPVNATRRRPRSRCSTSAPGYVQRSIHLFPKQGSRAPWQLRMNYLLDLRALRHGPLQDDAIRFSGRRRDAPPRTRASDGLSATPRDASASSASTHTSSRIGASAHSRIARSACSTIVPGGSPRAARAARRGPRRRGRSRLVGRRWRRRCTRRPRRRCGARPRSSPARARRRIRAARFRPLERSSPSPGRRSGGGCPASAQDRVCSVAA